MKLRKSISKLAAVDDQRVVILCSDGLLCLLDVEKMELIKTKQSQLNKVADFALNPRPSSHTKGLLDYELLLAGEKKKSVALMHITQDNKFVRIVEEFQDRVCYLQTKFEFVGHLQNFIEKTNFSR